MEAISPIHKLAAELVGCNQFDGWERVTARDVTLACVIKGVLVPQFQCTLCGVSALCLLHACTPSYVGAA